MAKKIRLRPALWSTRSRVAAGLTAAALIIAGALVGAHYTQTATIPVLTVVVASGSLVVVAAANYISAQRVRQHVTMQAWTEWSDGTLEMRLRLSRHFGRAPISKEQAVALVTHTDIPGLHATDVPGFNQQTIRDDLSSVLNGLERLAVGARYGCFDSRIIRAVGGTAVAAFFDRFELYVEERRTTDATNSQGIKIGQKSAFESLRALRKDFRRSELLKEQETIDNERLASIRAKRS